MKNNPLVRAKITTCFKLGSPKQHPGAVAPYPRRPGRLPPPAAGYIVLNPHLRTRAGFRNRCCLANQFKTSPIWTQHTDKLLLYYLNIRSQVEGNFKSLSTHRPSWYPISRPQGLILDLSDLDSEALTRILPEFAPAGLCRHHLLGPRHWLGFFVSLPPPAYVAYVLIPHLK